MEQPFIEKIMLGAAQEVFSTMLGMDASQLPPRAESPVGVDGERVVALIGIAGDYIGTGMIGCSPKMACKVSSVMMMADYTAVGVEVLDAMGEIANMIFGNVKTALENQMGALGLSIPTVVFGRNFSTRSMGNQSWINVPLKVEEEEMEVRFCIAPNVAILRGVKQGFKREYALAEV